MRPQRLLLPLLLLAAVTASAQESGFVAVNGVKLHYLDWKGGSHGVLLLLAGMGNDAHVFDTFAPHFTDRYRVLALTRRGFGESAHPKSGYEVATRVDDIRLFLDKLGVRKVTLIGHSLAGDEITDFAAKYPTRVEKVVYLDAADDRAKMVPIAIADPWMVPMFKKMALEAEGSPEAAKIPMGPEMTAQEYDIAVQLMKTMLGWHPDYTKVRASALAFYATSNIHPMSEREPDAAKQKQMNEWFATHVLPITQENIDEFRREAPHGTIVEMPGASHYLFLGKTQDEVVKKIRAFLQQ